MTAACWLKEEADEPWYLYIVTPLVRKGGSTRAAYRQLDRALGELPDAFGIGPLAIKVVGPTEPLARDLLQLYQRTPALRAYPSHWGKHILGPVSFVDTFLYPPPAAAVNGESKATTPSP